MTLELKKSGVEKFVKLKEGIENSRRGEKCVSGSCCGRELRHIWNRGKTREGVGMVEGGGYGHRGGQGLP